MAELGSTIGSWWLSDRSTPDDLEERLLGLGLRVVPGDHEIDGMACVEPPPPGPAQIEARRLRTLEEYLAGERVLAEAFETPPERRVPREQLEARWPGLRESRNAAAYGAWLDGELVAMGRAFFSPRGALLAGGSTLPTARGRGAYRALVRARWDDAAARGTPALAVQAKQTSAPILARLGFEPVVRFHRLEDVLPAP